MKKYIYLFLTIASLGVMSCDDKNQDLLTGDKNEGGLLNVKNAAVAYVVGNGNTFQYSASLSAFQGDVKVVSVDVYKQFTSVDGSVSNKILLKNFTFPNSSQLETINCNFTYDELIEGLTVNNNPLPSNDANLQIGDFWTLSYVAKTSTGKSHTNNKTTEVAVGTRFSGEYKCVNGEYYRIGVLTASTSSWPSKTVIKAVNSTTYRVQEYFGIFSANEFYFTIDSSDNINYPDNTPDGTPQSGNGQPFITCQSNPADMGTICANSNTVVRDNVDGKDRLVMSFVYYTQPGGTATPGPRIFYQVLEKIVD
jgi:hypothetical protein